MSQREKNTHVPNQGTLVRYKGDVCRVAAVYDNRKLVLKPCKFNSSFSKPRITGVDIGDIEILN